MIEITRKGEYIYKLNDYNKRIVDRRLNRHNARFKRYKTYDTEEEARVALMAFERGDTKEKGE